MDLRIKHEEYNALLKRKEIHAEVDHDQAGTPSRMELRKAVASKYSVKPESVYVIDVRTNTGAQTAMFEVQVYDDNEGAQRIVPKYIKTRNLPPEERKRIREEEAKKAEAKPKQDKPKEKPKEEKPKQEAKAAPESPKKEKEPEAK
jgi:small subunit ribosomal protein S24e